MTVVNEQESRERHSWRGQDFIQLDALPAIAALVIVLGQHIDNSTPPPYLVTQKFPNMALSLPNLVPLTHQLRRHSSFLSRTV